MPWVANLGVTFAHDGFSREKKAQYRDGEISAANPLRKFLKMLNDQLSNFFGCVIVFSS